MTTAPFLSRPLGNFLLIAQLSEDALGSVFRAIYAPDERRFVRLRILQSPELSPQAIFSAIERAFEVGGLVHRAIVPNAEVGFADGLPYLAWDEIAGWTLDQFLERVRSLGVRVPPAYALLVAERIASALEFARQDAPGRPMVHGLLWPGFVAISPNAEIRVGGFGLAEAFLNSIHRPRIAREVAPYAAPEARETGEVSPDADVYSLGVLLAELLTGRRPRRQNPAEALTDGPPVPEEVCALVLRALAPSGQRPPSVTELRREIQDLLTASPYALYTGNLALFLYRLLNPEGQNVMDAADGDVTNPVDTGEPEPDSWPFQESGHAVALDDQPSPLSPPQSTLPALLRQSQRERSDPRYVVTLARLPQQPPRPKTVWLGRAGLAAAASLVAASVFFPTHRNRTNFAPATPTAVPAPAAAGSDAHAEDANALALASAPAASQGGAAHTVTRRRGDRDGRQAGVATALARQSAESLRLRAALARVEAERIDAQIIARDLYAEAQASEKEGNRLLARGIYKSAQPVFMRATQLYRAAEDVSREERVRLVRLSLPQ